MSVDLRNGIVEHGPTMALQAGGIGDGRGMCINAIPHLVAFGGNNTSGAIQVSTALNASGSASGRMDFESETFVVYDTTQNSAVCFTGDITHALNTANNGKGSSEDGTGRGVPTIAYTLQHAQIGRIDSAGPQGKGWQADVAFTQDSRTSADAVVYGAQVRRLTPRECERLQGFPDDHTLVLSRGKPAADGPRYKALGNSMAVPVMAWIGRQIDFAWRFF